jgi:hypothetical protein
MFHCEEKMDDKLKGYTDLFVHWDSSYWYAFYVFLVLQGALIVAFTDVYTSNAPNGRDTILFIIPMGGLILSGLWMLVMNRKFTYTLGAQEQLKTIIPEVYISAKKMQKGLANTSSSLIVNKILPLLFVGFWFILLIIPK